MAQLSSARRCRAIGTAFLAACLLPVAATSQETPWSGFRGPGADGSVATSRPPADALRVAWKRPLGAGYSGISIGGGLAVTMAALHDVDDPGDYLVALDPRTGDTRWRLRIADVYPGRDGALDGPVATPAILGDRVFALDPSGRLVAARLSDGELLWSRDVGPVGEDDARPIYGFGTSPLAYDDLVVVQPGGPSAVRAFDAATGAPVWEAGSGTVDESSPLLLTVHGRRQVVYSTLDEVGGLDPDEGSLLWAWPHDGAKGGAFGASTTTPLPVGGDRLFMTPTAERGVMLRIPRTTTPLEEGAEGPPIETLWEENALTRTYCPPTLWGDTLFGYTARLLSAYDLETGERLWRSREPGDGFLIAVDGRLVVATKSGGVHLADAARDGYRELASLDLFDELIWTPPTHFDDSVLVRSVGELARIELVSQERVRVTETPDAARPARIAELESKIGAGADPKSAVDSLLEGVETPIVEGDRALFLWRGEATDVGLGGDFFGMRVERPFRRVEGTDLWWREVEIDPRLQYSYTLFVDYRPTPDPRNPRREQNTIWGPDLNWLQGPTFEASWFAGGSWPGPPDHLRPEASTARSGELTAHRLTLPAREAPAAPEPNGPPRASEIEVQVWLPPGYGASDTRYPVVYVHDPQALDLGRWRDTLDRRVGESFAPLIAVFVPPPWMGLPFRDFVEVVVPWVDSTFRTVPDRTARANVAWFWHFLDVGPGIFSHPDLFGGLATQSYHGFDLEATMIEEAIQAADAADRDWRIYFDWSIADSRSPSEGWDMALASRRMVDLLRSHGFQPIARGDLAETTDWKSWRLRTHELLGALFPPTGP